MKELNELILPDNVGYTEDHEWAEKTGDTIKVGVTDYAQDQLGDIVFVELPEVGETFEKGEEFGTLESVKAVSELYLPIAGEVVAINEELDDAPELINEDPYKAWMLEIKPASPAEYDQLLSAKAYLETLEG
ncbi:MAG: glycine cleavage system protein H [Desulfobulbus propionicus]|nr:MAG: glycine cleavage system protein H [Desulfobulbus propionicus]